MVARLRQHLTDSRTAPVLALAARALVARRDDGGIERNLLSRDLHLVANRHPAAVQNTCKDALARHDAVADLMIDLAVAMALLADLRDLEEDIPDAQTRPDGQFLEAEPLCNDVLAECAEVNIGAARAEVVDLTETEEAHLTMPIARMGVAVNAVLRHEENAVHRVFLRPALLADAERSDLSHNQPPT